MNPEHNTRLNDLEAFSMGFQRIGRTRRQFWAEFHERSGDLQSLAFADEADHDLRSRYFEILDDAHEAYGGPDEVMDEVME